MERLGFIGFGNMGSALAAGFVKYGGFKAADIYAFAPDQHKLAANCKAAGINPCPSPDELVQKCDTIFLACKPYQIEGVIGQLGDLLDRKSIVSVAAGWDFNGLKALVPENARVQCVMPNTPVSVGKGIFLMAESNDWEKEERQALTDLFNKTGKTVVLADRLIDAGTAVSGCGPAFFDMVMEAMADGAVKKGIPRPQAYELASAAMAGCAALQLETGLHPGQLKDAVCSPGGTTIKGVASLEESGIRSAFIKAVDAVLK